MSVETQLPQYNLIFTPLGVIYAGTSTLQMNSTRMMIRNKKLHAIAIEECQDNLMSNSLG